MTTQVTTMRHRFAAQTLIEELLRLQGTVPRRSTLGRFFGVSPLDADSVASYLGAKGEQAVGALLENMPPEWTVFHALPVGTNGLDIDHVVVGPAGIFTITSKLHRGKTVWVTGSAVVVSGRNTSYVPDAEFGADRVSKLLRVRMPLSAPPRPVVAIVDPKQLTVTEKPAQVQVMDARKLRSWLLSLPETLAWPERMEITALIDNPLTWRATSPSSPASTRLRSSPRSSPDDVLTRFAALDEEVRASGVRRLFWSVLAIAVIAGAAITMLPHLVTVPMTLVLGTH